MQLFTLRNAQLLPFFIVVPYALFIALLLIPSIQRNVFYAHKVNPARWQDLSNIEQFGFHRGQVIPFTFTPADDSTVRLHAWHLLPLELYLAHESELKASHHNTSHPSPSPLHLLTINPAAHVIISLHGNAGHLASSHRPTTYQHLLGLSTPTRPLHVLAFDYRGFGLSTGHPTEQGLIADGVALLRLLADAGIAMSRVTLLGQSLGTAVATGAFHHWTRTLGQPAPRALVLLASFSSVPSLMDGYSVKGVVPPLLSGLDYFPAWVKGWVVGRIADPWDTGSRLADLWAGDVALDLSIVHARDDWEIPWREGWCNFVAVADTRVGEFGTGARGFCGGGEIEKEKEWAFDLMEGVADGGRKRVRWELVRHGGHNRVAVGEQMKGVVLRSLERERSRTEAT